MNSKSIWASLLVLSTLGPGVWAQLTNVAACPAGFSWNENSLGQDPCTISSILDAACRGVGSYAIPLLNSTQNYVPPQKDSTSDLTCDCDTVMYSLYMACTSCQGGVIYSWTTWIAQCESVYVTQYPHDVPYGTAIPHWAFYDITTLPTKTYNDSVAISVGRDPEVTGQPLSTATLGTSTSSRSSSFPSTFTSSGSGSGSTNTSTSSGSKSNTAAIVGGVVGGVVVLIAAVVIGGICISRRKRGGGKQQQQQQQFPPQPLPAQETLEYQKVQPMSPILSPITPSLPYNTSVSPNPQFNMPPGPNPPFNGQAGPNPQFNGPPSQNPQFSTSAGQNPQFNGSYYNPEDPTTFPPPISDGQSSVTYTNPTGQNGPGWYGGMPEL